MDREKRKAMLRGANMAAHVRKILEPMGFTRAELKAIRVMCEGSIPNAVYEGVMSSCAKIDAALEGQFTLMQAEAEYRADHPPIKDSTIDALPPPLAPSEPMKTIVKVRCNAGHTWEAFLVGSAPGADKCPTCGKVWKGYDLV